MEKGFSVTFLLFVFLALPVTAMYAVNHSGTIGTETWVAPYSHFILSNVTIPDGETLTIEAGASVRFSAGTSLIVEGRLIADGTSLDEIVFTADATTPTVGFWDRVVFNAADEGCVIDHCIFQYGGNGNEMVQIHNSLDHISITNSTFANADGDGLFLWDSGTSPSTPHIANCSFSGNDKYGLNCGASYSAPIIANCSFSNNELYGICAFAAGLSSITGTIAMSGNGTNAILAQGGNVSTGTWADYSVPIHLSGYTTVVDGDTLTINAGSDIRFSGNHYLKVDGALIANGTSGNHIKFSSASAEPSPGAWQYLQLYRPEPGTIINYCDFSYGGSTGPMLYLNEDNTDVTISNCTFSHSHDRGIYIYDTGSPASNPTISNCSVQYCGTTGIEASGSFALPWISDCSVSYCGSYPIRVNATGLSRLTGNIYGNSNGNDGILVDGGSVTTGTWNKMGFPYYMNGSVTVVNGNTLTIEAGTQLLYVSDSYFNVEGALVANGTESQRIVFSSGHSSPNPGDWKYLGFSNADAGTSLSWCEIKYAGSSNANLFFNNGPNDFTVSNCYISNSQSSGVMLNDYYATPSCPTFSNCTITDNAGFGIDCAQGLSIPYIQDCTITNNGLYSIYAWASGVARITGNNVLTGNNPDGIFLNGGSTETTTWYNFGAPYYLNSNITIENGDTLTVEPGTEFKFVSQSYIEVQGTLIADGTPESHIVFTSASASPSPGDWKFIYFNNAEPNSRLDYCDISYGGNSQGNLYFHNGPNEVTVSNSTISHSHSAGVRLNDHYTTASCPTFSNCDISDNASYGIDCSSSSSYPYIENCSFDNNGSYTMRVYANGVNRISGSITSSGCNPDGIMVDSASIGTMTWPKYDFPYYIAGSLLVGDGSTLTILPGTQFLFLGNYELRVDGALIADGTPEEHIVFTSAQASPEPGNWRYLYFYQADAGTVLDYCDLSYGGSSNGALYIHNGPNEFPITNCSIVNSATNGIRISDYYTAWSNPTIDNCRISNNSQYGIDCGSGGSNPIISNCTVSDNGGAPLNIWAYNINRVAGNCVFTGNGDQRIEVLGSNFWDATIRNHGIPYRFTGTGNLSSEYTLNIEPGTVIQFDDGVGLNINGTLIAEGNASEQITFTTSLATPAPGGWRGIYMDHTGAGTSLDYCNILYGGDCGANVYITNAANVQIDNSKISWGSQDGVYCSDYYTNPSSFILTNSTISNNAHYGLDLTGGASNTSISDCTIQNNAQQPIKLYPYQVVGLGGTLTFGGNAIERILVTNGNTNSGTWHNYGIPYQISGDVDVQDNQAITLEPGTALHFDNNVRLRVFGGLTANGTESQHIQFDSAQESPSAGNWKNVYLEDCTSTSSFQYCDFTHGGSSDGMLYLTGAGTIDILNCTFNHSATNGIYINDQYHSGSSATIDNCDFQNAASCGIRLTNTGSHSISNSTLHGCQTGLYISSGSAQVTGGNAITGNTDYGVQLVGNASLLFGSDTDHWNDIYGNGLYDFCNGNYNINASYVYWGTTDQSAIEDAIYDYNDNASMGVVNYWPFLDQSHETQYNQSLDAPVISSVTVDGGNVIIQWNSVAGATGYRVYSSGNPEVDFDTWTLVQDNITTLSWSGAISQGKMFYRIVACSN